MQDNYIEKVLRTKASNELPMTRMNDENMDFLHGAMGLSTEANEVLDIIKKHIFYGKPIDREDLMLECSDCLWYIGVILNRLGYSFQEVMDKNIEKLQKRYPEKFTEDKAINRVEYQLNLFDNNVDEIR